MPETLLARLLIVLLASKMALLTLAVLPLAALIISGLLITLIILIAMLLTLPEVLVAALRMNHRA